jgi:hypothetical protein
MVGWSKVTDSWHHLVSAILGDSGSDAVVLDAPVHFSILLIVLKLEESIHSISKDRYMLGTNGFTSWTEVELQCTKNGLLIFRLLWINTPHSTVGAYCAWNIVRRVTKRVVMQWKKQWKQTTIVLNNRTVIWQLYGWCLYHPFCVSGLEVIDVIPNAGVCPWVVKTLLMNINFSFVPGNVSTMLLSVPTDHSLHISLITTNSLQKSACQFNISEKAFFLSFRISVKFFHMIAKCLIAPKFQYPMDGENQTALAVSSSQWLFCTVTRSSYGRCLIYCCHRLVSYCLTWRVLCCWIPTQWCHRWVYTL